MHYYNVAAPIPSFDPLTYLSDKPLELGQIVEVNIRRTKHKAAVIGTGAPSEKYETKPISNVVEGFKISQAHLKWLLWIANYYHYPPGLVIQSIFPPLEKKEPKKKPKPFETIKPLALTQNQTAALKKIEPLEDFKAHLLHGVTGSGKTEIYLELFEEIIINKNQQGLFLLPEISLTPQLERRFKERFGDLVSTYHSQLTPRQKTNSWYNFIENKTKILIGARSALFCPSENIGLIVVDEEHESSFKQEEKFLYNARDAALKLAQIKNIPIVLGSATPSIETMHNVDLGKINYIRLKEKVFDQKPPAPEIIDMTKINPKPDPFWLSPILKDKIENHIAKKKQVALFLNRRGWSSHVQCYACGHKFQCANCDISLTLHKKTELFCHYCGYGEKLKETCPECNEDQIYKFGLGTEQIFKDCEKLFPSARILKFDRDEVNTKNQLKEAIEKIDQHEVDLIIGTQMISKGLDFEHLTLMGVVDADQSFSFPDFRATEKSVQQINQVLGRVGRRKEQKAEVVIQTRTPEHMVFSFLDEQKYNAFSENVLDKRKTYSYPPFKRMVSLLIKSPEKAKALKLAEKISQIFIGLKDSWSSYDEVSVLGPSLAPIEKIRNEYRYHVILKFPAHLQHQPFIKEATRALGKLPARTKLSINVDPIDLM